MSENLVGSMTKSELTKILWFLLESKLKNMASKSDIEAITNANQKIMELNLEMSNKIIALEKRNDILESQMDEKQKKNTENNLMLRITSQEGINEKELIKNSLVRLIQPTPAIENQHIREIKSNNNNVKNFIVKLESKQHVITALKVSKKLQGTGITIAKDLPLSIRQKRNKLLNIRRRLNEFNPQIKVLVRDDRMYIEKKDFRWSSSRGLLQNNNNGVFVLNKIYQVDLSNQLCFNMETQMTDDNNRAEHIASPTFSSGNILARTSTNSTCIL